MTAGARWGRGPWAPVVVERAGGGVARLAPDTAPLRALRGLAREAAETLQVARSAVWRLGPGGTPVRCLTRFHRGTRIHEDDLSYPDALGTETWHLLERLAMVAMEDVREAPSPAPALRRYLEESEIRALLAVPIRREGKLAGFLALEEVSGPRGWTAEERRDAAALAWRVEQHWAREGAGVGTPMATAAPIGTGSGVGSHGPGADLEGSSPVHASSSDPPGGQGGGSTPRMFRGSPSGAQASGVPTPSAPAGRVEGAPPADPSPKPTSSASQVGAPRGPASAFGHRRELRARLQRLRTLERAGILGAEAAARALHLLHVQRGTLGLLQARLDGDPRSGMLLADVREALEGAVAALEGFLGWTRRGEAGLAEVELNALVGDLAVRLGKLTGDRVGLLYAPSSEPLLLRAHPDLLSRALEALVRNARTASAPGDRVRVAVQRGESAGGRAVARLVVSDRGEGIAAGDLPWIFEPWFSTRGEGAEGMGLPLVQAVVEGHGGWVDVVSTRGEGSRFTLNLPLSEGLEGVQDVGVSEARSELEGDAGQAEPPLALVVEDEPHLARLLARSLEGEGFRVELAEGGPEASRLLRTRAHEAVLLVTERILPDGSEGMSLLRHGRALAPYLQGMVLDRKVRAGIPQERLREIREASRIPSDVPLLVSPLDPAAFLAEVRARVPRPTDDEEKPSDGGGILH